MDWLKELGRSRLTVPEEQWKQTTPLSLEDEIKFRRWYDLYARATRNARNPDEPEHFYDYRGFWNEDRGLTPLVRGLHLIDKYKRPGHPTYFVRPGITESIWK